MTLFKERTSAREGDDIRETFERLAKQAGYSGTFSVFDEDDLGTDEFELEKPSIEVMDGGAKTEPRSECSSDTGRDKGEARLEFLSAGAREEAEAEYSAAPGESEMLAAESLGKEIESLVTRDTHFRNALVGGFDKNSVWEYVDEMDAALVGMQNSYEKQFKDLSAECTRISAECSLVHEQMDEVEKKCKESEEELSRKCDSLDEMLKERNRRIAELESELEECDRTIDEQKTALEKGETLESQCAAMEEEVERLTREKDGLEASLSAMKASVDEMTAKMEEAARKREELLSEIENAKCEAEEAGKKAAASAERCKELEEALSDGKLKEQELESNKESLREALTELEEAKNRAEFLKTEKASLVEKAEGQARLYAQTRERVSLLEQDLGKERDAKAELASTLDSLKTSLNDTELENEELRTKAQELVATKELLDEAMTKNEKLVTEAGTLKDRLSEVEWESVSLRNMVRDLTAQRDETLKKLSEVNQSMESLLRDNRRLMSEVESFAESRLKIAAVLGVEGDGPSEAAASTRSYGGIA